MHYVELRKFSFSYFNVPFKGTLKYFFSGKCQLIFLCHFDQKKEKWNEPTIVMKIQPKNQKNKADQNSREVSGDDDYTVINLSLIPLMIRQK